MTSIYTRDMVGYGAEPPHAQWPGGARIALQFVINYEEGAENSILHGDTAAEAFLSEWIGAQPTLGLRNMNMESLYEYGSRAGFWRLYRAFTQRDLPVTVYAVAMALERNPPAVAAMVAAGWEMATHGYRWIDYQYVAEAVEREHIAKAVAIHTQTTGTRPLGWYQGRCSPNTRRLVAEEGVFSTTRTAMPMICRTGTLAPANRNSSFLTPSTQTTPFRHRSVLRPRSARRATPPSVSCRSCRRRKPACYTRRRWRHSVS